MGDISRHLDIFLSTRAAIPAGLLADAGLTVADLTYVELGNFLTDVSQFRDPVAYTLALPDAQQREALAEFFRELVSGTTHALFGDDGCRRSDGVWAAIDPIPAARVTEVYDEFFTQYYPHEHADQPPYVWEASQRSSDPLYRPSARGVMTVVDDHYVAYLAEGLMEVEDDWRTLDLAGRQRLLVRLGKLLHGVEDWFFHSNVAELLELGPFGREPGESDEDLLRRFVTATARRRPEFVAADPVGLVRLRRRLYRRLRFPTPDGGTVPALRHAYPGFPTSQDTADTLLQALDELKLPPTAFQDGVGELVTQYAVEVLQPLVDASAAATAVLDEKGEIFGQAADNGAFAEVVGSHSLMSKDTPTSEPFFEDARTLATVASSIVVALLLHQVAVPAGDRPLGWDQILRRLIRYPPPSAGWERRALAGEQVHPEFARLAEDTTRPPGCSRSRRSELEDRYRRLAQELSG
ncbi:hypothetical protein E1218_18560 [Kribbella turkmenica]|uniref:Uncharacterized protein n=1 Tax=Kribbella turkmenica TaxID=2530375 RepID=A0A4R4WYN8_9ACTN|nr:hypothetical protein [Kribbella turkmenica]TDD22918.1 hypothetical protein E1218_18560 [Kribbella turkmenica]